MTRFTTGLAENDGEKMTKFLALVEVDDENSLLTEISDAIGAIGDHVTVEKFINLDVVERRECVRVDEKIWGPDDTYPQVSLQPSKFRASQYVDVILLPGTPPSKY